MCRRRHRSAMLDDGRVEIAGEQHAVQSRRVALGAKILDDTEEIGAFGAREHASLWRLEAHPHRPQHQVNEDEKCQTDFTQQQGGAIDGGAHPNDQDGSADQQNQARHDVTITEESQCPELFYDKPAGFAAASCSSRRTSDSKSS